MKVVKRILLAIVSIIILLLVIALFIKKDFSISREITVNKPKADVFNYFKLIRNQEKYSVWVMKDPNIKIVYTGTDGTPGFTSSWTSEDKNVGVGAQEIKQLKEGESMDVEVRFKKPFEGTNYANNNFSEPAPGQTKVVTTFSGTQKYPMNLMNLFIDKILGKDMQQNLINAKANIEKQ